MATFERPARTGRVTLPGVDMHYLDWPERALGGVPVVLLHPNRTNARVSPRISAATAARPIPTRAISSMITSRTISLSSTPLICRVSCWSAPRPAAIWRC